MPVFEVRRALTGRPVALATISTIAPSCGWFWVVTTKPVKILGREGGGISGAVVEEVVEGGWAMWIDGVRGEGPRLVVGGGL